LFPALAQSRKFIIIWDEIETMRDWMILSRITSEIVELHVRLTDLMIQTEIFEDICGKDFELSVSSYSELLF